MTQTGQAGTASNTTNTCSTGKYSQTFNGIVGYKAEANAVAAPTGFTLSCTSATSPGLILNIGYSTQAEVTFTLPAGLKSVSFDVCDLTKDTSTTGSNTYRYQDTLTFSQSVAQVTGDTTLINATTGTTFNRTAHYPSSTAGGGSNITTFRIDNPTTSVKITYTAPISCGWQFIALKDVTVCR